MGVPTADWGGGAVVKEFSEAHRPSVLFIIGPTDPVYFSS